MKFACALFAMLTAFGCHDDAAGQGAVTPPVETASGSAGSGSAIKPTAPAAGSADTYTPAEFKAGMNRFKDVAVYVDGKPAGFLAFGELPIALKPTWVKHKVNVDKPLDCKDCKIWKEEEQRFYRFTDYLRAIGIEPKTIREIHIQGPKETNTIIATGKDLLTPDADELMFMFGLHVRGKPIPHVPMHFGNGLDPDKITAVMIYVKKTPPTLDGGGFVLDGQPIEGVPYFGEPLRGGIRIYADDKLAAIIKRQDLDGKQAITNPDGEMSWSVADFLKSRGVDTSKMVEAWVIRDDARKEHFPMSELAAMRFEAPSKSGKSQSGAVLLGDKKIVANVIALHSHALKPDELPVVRHGEE